MTAVVLKAGATYFLVVYALGFLLGTVRVLLVIPRIGETGAVLLETPIILGASWVASRWSANRFAVPAEAAPRLAMGGFAVTLLMLAEIAVSMLAFGRAWTDIIALYRSLPGVIGLAAQAAFAVLPFVQALLKERGR